MIEQEEFEKLIRQVIDGKITRREISIQYGIAIRTINGRITELATTNPELYQKFIDKYPFKPKAITHINFVELTKKIMKEGCSVSGICGVYDISERTFSRRIREMKDSDTLDELTGLPQRKIYELYKKYSRRELSFDDEILIDNMKIGNIQEQERVTDRKTSLEELLQKYYQLISEGLSKAEAARKLGFSYEDMYKKEDELKRIKTEQKVKQKKREFKKGLEVSNIPRIDIDLNQGNELPKREEVKGEE